MSKRDGMTYREIAEELNLSEKTVEHQISKALKTLRGKKDDFLADFFYILPFIHGGILLFLRYSNKRMNKSTVMKGKEIIFALSILTLPAPTLAGTPKMMVEAQTSTTIRQQMDWLHRIRKINFVYDSLLDGELNIKYHGPDIQHLSVKKALKALFEKTHILYNINANYVILKRKPVQQISTSYTNINHKVQQVQRRHTLSGYVRDESGESLINATIYDLTDGIGTTTNEYGFFSLTLPEGEHQLRFSYVGYADKVEKLNLSKDMHHNMALRVDGKLPEVV